MDLADIRDVNVEGAERLPPPAELSRSLPVSEAAHRTVRSGRDAIAGILSGESDSKLVVTGPCSIHDADLAREYALRVRDLQEKVSDRLLLVMRAYLEKSRTTLGWTGLLSDPRLDGSNDVEGGLRTARKLLLDIAGMGVPIATEFVNHITPQYIGEFVSLAAFGARTSSSQLHRALASGLSMPVGFKNGTDGDVASAIDALLSARSRHTFIGVDAHGQLNAFTTRGNRRGFVILRGGAEPNYDRESVASTARMLADAGLPTKMVIDCSHGNSGKLASKQAGVFKDVVGQMTENPDVVGLMLESSLKPGRQLVPADLRGFDRSTLEPGVSITDECIGWEETERLVLDAYETLRG